MIYFRFFLHLSGFSAKKKLQNCVGGLKYFKRKISDNLLNQCLWMRDALQLKFMGIFEFIVILGCFVYDAKFCHICDIIADLIP